MAPKGILVGLGNQSLTIIYPSLHSSYTTCLTYSTIQQQKKYLRQKLLQNLRDLVVALRTSRQVPSLLL